MNVLSLFSGIGGLELGLERAGMTVVGQVEIDPFCQRVLAKHWPEVPRHDDVRTAGRWWSADPLRPRVDVVAGGFPCQPVSAAGRKLAQEDHRWLWPAMAEVIESVKPRWVIGENVPGLLDRGLPDVLRDLHRLGYQYRVGHISACAMGAPHMRRRLFIVAHAEGIGCGRWGAGRGLPVGTGEARPPGTNGRGATAERPTGWETEPGVARMANGIPRGVDRRRALGNAVVPAVAEFVGRLVMSAGVA